MILWIGIGVGTLAVLVLVMLAVGKAVFEKAQRETERGLARHGLREFAEAVRRDVSAGRRPGEHVRLPRIMLDILEGLSAKRGTSDQVPFVEPGGEIERVACEELANLEKLSKVEGADRYCLPGEAG